VLLARNQELIMNQIDAIISMMVIICLPTVFLPSCLWFEYHTERKKQIRFIERRLVFYRENGPLEFVRECEALLLTLGSEHTNLELIA
jgi:hypothetical protein